MAERTARLGSMFYRDADGRFRIASAGETINVHPDYLERFDRLNILLGEANKAVAETVKPAEPEEVEQPKPRRGRPKKAAQ